MHRPIPSPDELEHVDTTRIDPGSVLGRCVSSIGLANTLKLLYQRGGTPIYIQGARARRDATLISSIIGPDAADAWRKEFSPAGSWRSTANVVCLPMPDAIINQIRDAAIRADTTHSLVELALMWGITTRTVSKIRAGASVPNSAAGTDKDDRQHDMFAVQS